MYFFRWLLFRRLRKGSELLGIVRKHFNHQRDVLPAKNVGELSLAMETFEAALRNPDTTAEALKKASAEFEELAHRWLKPYPYASYRDNFESFLGTAVLVFAFKTFFATPMEIPTGSAQPTYYGITSDDLRDHSEVKIPTGPRAWWERWIKGTTYYEIIAVEDGELRGLSEPVKQLSLGKVGFGKQMSVQVGNRAYKVSWVPENPAKHLFLVPESGGPRLKDSFSKGEPIIRCRVRSGDRLFVERFTYNFRRPKRGEYFVFQSSGMPAPVVQGTHYIKRLIAMGGEQVRIGDDRHVYVDGRALGTNDSGFEKLYAFDPGEPPEDSKYSGHVNGTVFRDALVGQYRAGVGGLPPGPADGFARMVVKLFPDERAVYQVRTNSYLGFGDNTMNSSDGRSWGDVPREKVIGKSWFVMWPFTDRWGW